MNRTDDPPTSDGRARRNTAQTIAVGVPAVGVLGGIVAFHDSHATLLGFPIIFAWLFLWMPLTTLALHIAWKIEEPEYADIAYEHLSGGGHRS